MTLYLDASVIVPLVVVERTTEAMLQWLGQQSDMLTIGRLAVGETGSAISRRRRMGQLTEAQGDIALAALDDFLATSVTIIDHEPGDIAEAARLVRRPEPKLLMPDAIHVATCQRLGQQLITSDRGLALVADLVGLECVLLD